MEHLKNFVEKPHEVFSNLPVCPFAKKARTYGKIECFVHSLLLIQPIYERLEIFAAQDFYETLWLIHPDLTIDSEQTDIIADELSKKYGPQLQFFSGHPESNFQMHGVYTRREPYPNIIAQKTSLLDRKEFLLKATKYYNKQK